MGKKSKLPPPEHILDIPQVQSLENVQVTPIVDTHTHLRLVWSEYRRVYGTGRYETLKDFVKGYYGGPRTAEDVLPSPAVPIKSLVDVWCEAPVLTNEWRQLADTALTPESRAEHWGDIDYWFVMGVHPHEAKNYTDELEAELKEAMKHPRNVGWGETGLDYHYNNSPPEKQKEVLIRQLKCAIELKKPLTIHTRSADEDIWEILSNNVPKDWKIHIHCFTDSVDLAQKLLNHFPNLYIGITGVITYATNHTTPEVIRILAASQPVEPGRSPLRILLETDAPYMVPANLTEHQRTAFELKSSTRLPLCHTGMIPWTADAVATFANQGIAQRVINEVENGEPVDVEKDKFVWTAAEVLRVARENAIAVYGV